MPFRHAPDECKMLNGIFTYAENANSSRLVEMRRRRVEFFDDQPIPAARADKLNRAKFAVSLAERISSWRGRNSLVVALMGEWGCGKTSLKNMVVECLARKKRKGVDILEFNPWQFSGHESLSASFFDELFKAVTRENPNSEDTKRRAGKMKLYASIAGLGGSAMKFLGKAAHVLGPEYVVPAAVLEGAGNATAEIGKTLGEGADANNAQAEVQKRSLAEVKVSVCEEMGELGRPLLVVIDDMDRLTSAEVRECVQLVKANADFPNVIYLLMFDRKVVAGALDVISGNCGDSFLEKIIQVAFQVPQPTLGDVHGILNAGLDRCLALEGVGKRWDERRWREMWFSGFRPYFKNLRSVYRFLSSLEFQIGQMRNGKTFELNPLDLIALEILRMFEPVLYDALPVNQTILVPTKVESLSLTMRSDDKRQEHLLANQQRILKLVPDDRRSQVTTILKNLFPSLFSEDQIDGRMMLRDLRVGIAPYFDRYFTLSIHAGDVSQAEIDGLLEALSYPTKFRVVCESLNAVSILDKAFEHLNAYNENLPLDQFPTVITSFAEVGDILPYSEWATAQISDALENAWRLVFFTLQPLEENDRRFQLLFDGFAASAGVRLVTFAAMRQERREGRAESNFLVSVEQAVKLRELALEKIRTAANAKKLRELPDLGFILWRWSQWTEPNDEARAWVRFQVVTEKDALWFLRTITSSMTSGSQIIRYIDISTAERFCNTSVLESLTTNLSLGTLERTDQRALRGFRYALRWRAEGRSSNYRGEHEKDGNPLAEEF